MAVLSREYLCAYYRNKWRFKAHKHTELEQEGGREGKPFEGVGGEISLHLKEYKEEHLLALSVAKYGIGRFKNMGFGSLIFTHKV